MRPPSKRAPNLLQRYENQFAIVDGGHGLTMLSTAPALNAEIQKVHWLRVSRCCSSRKHAEFAPQLRRAW
jgi:hypothetical protein